MRIAYEGTEYGGWQRQANHAHTIQQVLETSLGKILGEHVSTTGCGRTDAGVHASQFFVYLNYSKQLPDDFLFYMRKNSETDLAFLELISVSEGSQVCLDAASRTYDYFIHQRPDVWLSRTSWHHESPRLDVARVTACFSHLLNLNDFGAFCLTPKRHNSTIVDLKRLEFYQSPDGQRFRIRLEANRFLRGMVRVVVKELLAVGDGERSMADFENRVATGKLVEPVRLAPPQGLFLTGVSYPYLKHQPELPLTGQTDWRQVLPIE